MPRDLDYLTLEVMEVALRRRVYRGPTPDWGTGNAPTVLNGWPNGTRTDCLVCADPDLVAIQREKYGNE